MINIKLIYKVLGQLLMLEAAFMMLCLIMALYYQQDDTLAFAISITVTFGCGYALKYAGKDAENDMSRRDAYLIVALTWIIFSLFGTLPYIIGGYINSPTDAFFESISGFTTTGATILDDVEILPHGILFWRSLSQWIGGLGIVFFTIAILPGLVGGNIRVFAAEATGPFRARMHPRLSTTAKWIWSIYILLTALCMLAFWLEGMSWFDSINYSMSTTATGGFSPHNESIVFFHSPIVEYTSILFQFLSGINFTILYMTLFKFQFRQLYKNSEMRFYVTMVIISTALVMYLLIAYNDYDFEHAFRSALFQVVSFMTTTGLFSDDAGQWHHLTWVILGILMFSGACAGSTSGGFKCARSMMLLKVLRNSLRQTLHPKAVLPVKINGLSITQSTLMNMLVFFSIMLIACLCTASIMVGFGIDNTNAITISLSCISNVGPSLGTQIGPEMSWSMLPATVKWLCSFLMLMGRLEIISVLVLFTPAFWRDK